MSSATSNTAVTSTQTGKLSTGAIIGIVIGSIVFVLLLVFIIWILKKRAAAAAAASPATFSGYSGNNGGSPTTATQGNVLRNNMR